MSTPTAAPGWTPPAPPAQPGRGWSRRRKVAVGVGALLVAGGIASAFDGGGSAATPATAPPTPASPAVEDAPRASSSSVPPASTTARKAASVATTYAKISDRSWALIAKNPDRNAGKAIIVYGIVRQADSLTGPTNIRADISGTKKADSYGYSTNTILSGTEAQLGDIVQGDVFQAKVIVTGTYSYETQMGGKTTVPTLDITSIKIIGHND